MKMEIAYQMSPITLKLIVSRIFELEEKDYNRGPVMH